MFDAKELINLFKKLAFDAGEEIMEVYRGDFEVSYKEDDSPVTMADRKANDLIVNGLKSRYPRVPVLAEESADNLSRLSEEYCFIVDPLDGTKEFVKKNGEFTVNIALVRGGNPIAGLIYVPVPGECYYGFKGQGAFLYKDKEEPIHVSAQIGDIRLAVSRSHRSTDLDILIETNSIKNIIVAGSAYKGCLLARGDVEAYYRFGRTMEWDTAAMQIIVEEAGGIFSGMDERSFTYNRENPENPTGFYCINRKENRLIAKV